MIQWAVSGDKRVLARACDPPLPLNIWPCPLLYIIHTPKRSAGLQALKAYHLNFTCNRYHTYPAKALSSRIHFNNCFRRGTIQISPKHTQLMYRSLLQCIKRSYHVYYRRQDWRLGERQFWSSNPSSYVSGPPLVEWLHWDVYHWLLRCPTHWAC